MKTKLITYSFVALYLIAMLRPIAPVVEYILKYDYISKVLCINKEKVEMNCNGKCYVMKQLEQQKKDDFNSIRIIMEDYPVGFVNIVSLATSIPTLKEKTLFFYKENYSYLSSFKVFHPPTV